VHELSIAESIVEIAESAAWSVNATRVTAVRLRVGALAGVAADALRFSYDVVTAGTLLEGSSLEIVDVPVAVYCPTCDDEVAIDGIQCFECPRCATPTADVVHGRELDIESLEIEEDDREAG
jgi:hydrogenase nickel incorporation protein HypA/HybF